MRVLLRQLVEKWEVAEEEEQKCSASIWINRDNAYKYMQKHSNTELEKSDFEVETEDMFLEKLYIYWCFTI